MAAWVCHGDAALGCRRASVARGRYVFAMQGLSSAWLGFKRLFYILDVMSAFWWVAFLFLLGLNEQSAFLVLWRGSIVFIIIVFYLDTMRYSKFSLWAYSLTICIGTCVYLYGFTLIPEDVKLRIAIMLFFGTTIVLMFGRSSYLLSYSIYKIIAQNKRLVLAMDEMLIHDELTKQHNRRYFDTQLSRYLALFQRTQERFCVAMIDIDYFKQVNDTHGHAIGDDVLFQLSTYIKEKLRASDIFARYGGEEFVILLPMTEVGASVMMLDRLRAAVASREFDIHGQNIQLTISVGISITQDGDAAENLLARADSALYQAKETGRNKVVLFDERLALQG